MEHAYLRQVLHKKREVILQNLLIISEIIKEGIEWHSFWLSAEAIIVER